MTVVKLDHTHKEVVKPLFQHASYMGMNIVATPAFELEGKSWNTLTYDIFCNTYLSGLNNFHAYGYIKDGVVQALISFYESDEEPAWYYTIYRSMGDNNLLRPVLDAVIKHNEDRKRFKFYTLVHSKHSRLLRRFHWSEYNDERYDYIDEFVVPAKAKCYYTNAWELLFKKLLLPEESTVRCNFLKQKYRTEIPVGGNL
jgi:hypothetical protein